MNMSTNILTKTESCLLWREFYIYELASKFKVDLLKVDLKFYDEGQHILLPNYGEYFLGYPTVVSYITYQLSDRTDLILVDRFKQAVSKGDKFSKSIALFYEKEL